jgi:glycosyltransferase involved in cell wall biosynthesis
MLRAFVARGAEVHLFASRLGGTAPNDLSSVAIHPLGNLLATSQKEREQEAIEANKLLTCLLEEQHAFDLVYERYSLWSYAAIAFAGERDIPSILEVNAPLIKEQQRHRGIIDLDQARQIAYFCFGQASSVIAVSKEVAEYVHSELDSELESKARVHVVPNGVDPARFPNANATRTPSDPYTVGFVGTLKPWHGVNHLLDAFAPMSESGHDARLVIVGDGPESVSLRQQADALGPAVANRIEWAGAVMPNEIPLYLRRMDIAVAPYPALDDFYFSPLKILEYMAAGCAVVASRLGQISDLITHERNGLLVTPGCPVDLRRGIERLASDPKLAMQLSKAARATVSKDYTWTRTLDRILATIEPKLEIPTS